MKSVMVKDVQKEVGKLMGSDNTGHNAAHADKVMKIALGFADGDAKLTAHKDIIALIALLHDVDDYKLFGMEQSENLTNANNIMERCHVPAEIRKQVLDGIRTIGYSKRLKGIKPVSLEAMLVSDADMCEGIGVTGILRCHEYGIAKGYPFFDRNVWPKLDMSADEYMAQENETCINHVFEKLLKLKGLMLTVPGKAKASMEHDAMVKFLYQFFDEQDAPEWSEYLRYYLRGLEDTWDCLQLSDW